MVSSLIFLLIDDEISFWSLNFIENKVTMFVKNFHFGLCDFYILLPHLDDA